jgi:hypothetical protein
MGIHLWRCVYVGGLAGVLSLVYILQRLAACTSYGVMYYAMGRVRPSVTAQGLVCTILHILCASDM